MKHSFRIRALFIPLAFAVFLLMSCEKMILNSEVIKPPLPKTHTSKLATILDSLRYELDIPALAGAIVTDTGIVDAQAVGCRRYGGSMNITTDDQFHLGSNTKAITAVLIGILIDEGLLNWDTTLPEIFPEYANTMNAEYRDISILDLLSHSSGFMRDLPADFQTITAREQRAKLLPLALNQAPVVKSGTYFYSNLGYVILGAIAEKLTGRPYEQLLIEKVLQPLGITTAGFGPMGTPGLEDQPLQHTNSRSPIEPTQDSDLPLYYNSPGRLHLSIGDWAKFIQWVLAAEAGHQTLVSKNNASVLTSSIASMGDELYYGCGWMIYESSWAGGKTIEHAGSNGHNYSVATLAPRQHFAVISATNMGPGDKANPIDPVAWRLIQFYLNKR